MHCSLGDMQGVTNQKTRHVFKCMKLQGAKAPWPAMQPCFTEKKGSGKIGIFFPAGNAGTAAHSNEPLTQM